MGRDGPAPSGVGPCSSASARPAVGGPCSSATTCAFPAPLHRWPPVLGRTQPWRGPPGTRALAGARRRGSGGAQALHRRRALRRPPLLPTPSPSPNSGVSEEQGLRPSSPRLRAPQAPLQRWRVAPASVLPPFSYARPVRLAIPPHRRPFALLLTGLSRAASSPPFCALCPTGEAHRTTARPMRAPSQPRSPPRRSAPAELRRACRARPWHALTT